MSENNFNYPIPKPKQGFMFYFVIVILTLAMLASVISAYSAFSLVMSEFQAGLISASVELGLIAELIFAMQGKKVAVLGGLLALIISGTYNYIQVANNAVKMGMNNEFLILCLAFGIIIMVISLSITLGNDYMEFTKKIDNWQNSYTIAYKEWEERQEKRQDKLKIREVVEKSRSNLLNNTVNSSNSNLQFLQENTDNLQNSTTGIRTVRHKANLTEDDINYIKSHSINELKQKFPLTSEKTLYNWKAEYK